MTVKNYTHVSILADRSGSMFGIAEDATGGINTFLKSQKEVDGACTVSLYDFDNEYRKVFGPIDVSKAPEYKLEPRGSTALLDSLWKAIADTGSYLSSLPEQSRPENVIFLVVTDGYENSSVEVSAEQIKAKVSEQTDKYNWHFQYIGANVDQFAEAGKIGVAMSNATGYVANSTSTAAMYRGIGDAVTNVRLGTASFTSSMPASYTEDGTAVWRTSQNAGTISTETETKDNEDD